jgi:hypothetical protein
MASHPASQLYSTTKLTPVQLSEVGYSINSLAVNFETHSNLKDLNPTDITVICRHPAVNALTRYIFVGLERKPDDPWGFLLYRVNHAPNQSGTAVPTMERIFKPFEDFYKNDTRHWWQKADDEVKGLGFVVPKAVHRLTEEVSHPSLSDQANRLLQFSVETPIAQSRHLGPPTQMLSPHSAFPYITPGTPLGAPHLQGYEVGPSPIFNPAHQVPPAHVYSQEGPTTALFPAHVQTAPANSMPAKPTIHRVQVRPHS